MVRCLISLPDAETFNYCYNLGDTPVRIPFLNHGSRGFQCNSCFQLDPAQPFALKPNWGHLCTQIITTCTVSPLPPVTRTDKLPCFELGVGKRRSLRGLLMCVTDCVFTSCESCVSQSGCGFCAATGVCSAAYRSQPFCPADACPFDYLVGAGSCPTSSSPAGIALGASLAAAGAVLISVGLFCFWRIRRRSSPPDDYSQALDSDEMHEIAASEINTSDTRSPTATSTSPPAQHQTVRSLSFLEI